MLINNIRQQIEHSSEVKILAPTGAEIKIMIFLFFDQSICCGNSKEPSQCDGSLDHPKQMVKLMDNLRLKIFV